MNANRISGVVLRQLYVLSSSPIRVLPLFIWVGIDMVVWGFMTRYLDRFTGSLHFVPSLLGAVLLWDVLIRIKQGVTMAFFEDVWSRNFLNLFATPLTTGEYIAGLVATSLLTSLIGIAVMLVLAIVCFGLSFFAYGVALIPFLMILFLTGIALGIAGCALVLRYGPASEWFVWAIPAIVSPFAAVFYPAAILPEWMQKVAWAVPPSHVFEGVRGLADGHMAHGMTSGLALSLLYLSLACLYFRRVFTHAVRSGLLARYSAESA